MDWNAVTSSWSVNLWKIEERLQGNLLYELTIHILEKHRLVENLGLNRAKVYNFVFQIQEGYMFANAYHNRVHAADVLHGMYFLLSQVSGGTTRMSTLSLYCCVIAALVHDVGHDGLSNAYHVSSKSILATKFNGVSVLESYHLSQTFHLSQQEESNPFAGLNEADAAFAKQMIFELVLHTDMSKTNDLIKGVNNHRDTVGMDPNKPYSIEETKLVATMALKCADLSNPAKAVEISKLWAARIMNEFFVVGDLERNRGLSISNNCDRLTTSIPKCQASLDSLIPCDPNLCLTKLNVTSLLGWLLAICCPPVVQVCALHVPWGRCTGGAL